MKGFGLLSALLVTSAANAVTFTAASPTSAPKFTVAGTTMVKTASSLGGSYVVDGLAFTFTNSGNFAWDFYATAEPGAYLKSVVLTFNFTGGTGARWTTTTGAKYVGTNAEYSIPSVVAPLSVLGSTGTQAIDLSAWKQSRWHLAASDTFVLPAGVTISSIGASVTQSVPEPSSVAALGLVACGLVRRRRRQKPLSP